MATSAAIPMEEYLRTSYEYDHEWVDGEVRERAIPDELHSAIQQFLFVYFENMKRELGIRVRPDLRVKVAARRFRIPDVTLLRADAPFQPIPTDPPLLCVEVISKDDRVSELHEKVDDYLRMGVQAVWIIDPRLRTMTSVDLTGSRDVEVFELPGTRVHISRAELFAELDELQGLSHNPPGAPPSRSYGGTTTLSRGELDSLEARRP